MNDESGIEATGLGFRYKSPPVEALEDLTFGIPRGSFTAIMGPNGSGKTTLLRLILGLLEPTSGDLTVFGARPWANPAAVQRCIGYVPQRENVNVRMPLRVKEVVVQGVELRAGGMTRGGAGGDRLRSVLEMVGLEDLADRPFSALSGGEQQRALIARALAVEPEILILDEPFSAVDMPTQQEISELLSRLAQEGDVTILAAVHNVTTLVHFLDSILLINRRLIAFDAPDRVLVPDVLREAYGIDVPVLICEEGFRHPIMEDMHGHAG